jgi:hypothetical protein
MLCIVKKNDIPGSSVEVHRGLTCFTVSLFSVEKKVEIYFQVGSLSFNC